MKIIAYLKPSCGWSNGVRAIMRKHGLAYEDVDIINNRDNYAEMVRKSGQPLSPCVEIDGVMLADISGEELERWLVGNGIVQPNDEATGVPLDRIREGNSERMLAGAPENGGEKVVHWSGGINSLRAAE